MAEFNLNWLKEIGFDTPQPVCSHTLKKVRLAYLTKVYYSMMVTLELCQFVYGPTWCLYGPKETATMVQVVSWWDVSVAKLMTVGKLRLNLLWTFNAREGLRRKDDQLPIKFFKPLVGTGPTKGMSVTHEEIEAGLDEYYKLAGFNDDGIPT